MSSSRAHWPADHPDVGFGRIGVLLVNLGTPDGTDYWSMRRYLKEFLSDRRVIEANPLLWKLLLNTVILTVRPRKSGQAYEAIWDRETNESPLRRHTRELTEAIAAAIDDERLLIDWAMRYGNPSIAERLTGLHQQGCERIALVALYPQYSASTTATVYDKAFDALKTLRWQPAIRTLPPWHDDPVYIRAIAESIRAHHAALDWKPEVTLLSFHGLPKEYLLKGDPYHCQCAKSARLIREYLALSEQEMMLTFQSRFGPKEWLQPYTYETIERLAGQGVKRLAVATPGFVADCVETLEEIALQGREDFLRLGGEHYAAVPCLNASESGVAVIRAQMERELAGWWSPLKVS
jgi:protoporphyrin/coproporphyrin ferrochelatase